MSNQIERLKSSAGHLLDAFLILRQTYAILEPMVLDENAFKLRGSGKQATGFKILRNVLSLSCAQDIAKLTLDADNRTPSIINFVTSLQCSSLREDLRKQFRGWQVPRYDKETDPAIIDALNQMEVRSQRDRSKDFDRLYSELEERWILLSECRSMGCFLTIKDKLTAHKEVCPVADKYQFVDVESLGLLWVDLKYAIDQMQRIV
ncbi:MAG: hypothetical protein JRE63_08120, partial [Deltaproteobacteria bacterium]|nr:hypothetical protein [Deltaproteobacteria bacterium]